MTTPTSAGTKWSAHADERERERELDEPRAACGQRAAGQHVPARVGEHERGRGEPIVADELQRGPQAEEVAGPVQRVSERRRAPCSRGLSEQAADVGRRRRRRSRASPNGAARVVGSGGGLASGEWPRARRRRPGR